MIDHDGEIEKALGVSDLMRVRVQTYPVTGDDSAPTPNEKIGLLAASIHPQGDTLCMMSVAVSERTPEEMLRAMLSDAMGEHVPGLRMRPQQDPRGVCVALTQGPRDIVNRIGKGADLTDEESDQVTVTVYRITFGELMHRVLHHHLKETCHHDPV